MYSSVLQHNVTQLPYSEWVVEKSFFGVLYNQDPSCKNVFYTLNSFWDKTFQAQPVHLLKY